MTPPVTRIPDLAVNKPTESTFVTSSYVNVPPIDTLPEKVASPVKVETPETEILSKFVKTGNNIFEIPINYSGRSYKEGKKITFKDGIGIFFKVFKYKFL